MGNIVSRAAHHPRQITCELCGRVATVRTHNARICGRRACRLERDKRSRAKAKRIPHDLPQHHEAQGQ